MPGSRRSQENSPEASVGSKITKTAPSSEIWFFAGAAVPPESSSNRRKERSGYGFAVLTLVTISIIIFWTPVSVPYTIACFVKLDDDLFVLLDKVGSVLMLLECVLDPIYFVAAITELRAEVFRTIRLCH